MANKFCHNCGAPLQENAKFCVSCGTPALRPEAPAAVIPDPVPAAPVEEETVVIPEVQEPVAVPEEIPAEPMSAEPEAEAEAEETEAKPEVAAEPQPEPVEPEPVVETQPEPVIYTHPEPVTFPAEPVVEDPKAKKTKLDPKGYRRRGVLRTIIAVPLCIFIFLFALLSLVVWDASQLLDSKNLSKAVTNTIEDMDLAEMKAADLLGDTVKLEDPDVSIIEWAISEVSESSEGTIEVSKKDIEKFLEESNINDFIIEKLTGYTDAIFGDGKEAGVTKKEITKLLEDNAELAEEVFGVTIGDEEIEYFVDSLEEEGVWETLEPGAIEESVEKDMGELFEIFEIATNYAMIAFGVLVALTVLFVLLLAITNKWNMLRTSGDFGILLTILGVLMTVVAFSAPIIEGFLPKDMAMFGSLLDGFLMTTLVPALIVLGIGVLLIAIWVVGKKLVFKSAKKQA